MALALAAVSISLAVLKHMNIHQTEAYAQFLSAIGWDVITHMYQGAHTYYFLRKLPLLPVYYLKIQRLPLHLIDWQFVARLEREKTIVETTVEIDSWNSMAMSADELLQKGFSPAADFMLITKTRVVDLSKTSLQLIKEMKPKTRYNLKKCQKSGLFSRVLPLDEVVKNTTLFDEYFALLWQNAQRIHMLLLPKTWIRKQWQAFAHTGFVVEIREKNVLVALASFYMSNDTCSYNLNGSTRQGRKLFAPTLAAWLGMMEAKRLGKQWFDFDGIADERYAKRQRRFWGFSQFKAGFGGQEKYFPPMYRKSTWKRLFDLFSTHG